MAGLDNKISNIIGTKLPQWLLKQIELRSVNGARDSRDNDNILFLANKTAWVRLVSSIDLISQSDVNYFNNVVGISIADKSDLAKQYVLFGGTSKYLDKNSYQLRSGLGKDGAYGILGEKEIQKYGYKPMPGITNVAIETQGRLGSVRSATINFKCWDKAQLDIIDALYFKLGFTMFLEWGNTAFYTSKEPNRIQSSELYSIDPFQSDLSKEEIYIQTSKNSRESEGNYDGMLGIVTNFSFTYTQDGGFDCQLRLMALGVLADSIKINNIGTLPGIVEEEIRILSNTLIQIAESQNLSSSNPGLNPEDDPKNNTILRILNKKINSVDKEPENAQKSVIIDRAGILNSDNKEVKYKSTILANTELVDPAYIKNYDFIYPVESGYRFYSQKFGIQIDSEAEASFLSSISLDITKLREKLNLNFGNYLSNRPKDQPLFNSLDKYLFYIENKNIGSTSVKSYNSNYLFYRSGANNKIYYLKITIPDFEIFSKQTLSLNAGSLVSDGGISSFLISAITSLSGVTVDSFQDKIRELESNIRKDIYLKILEKLSGTSISGDNSPNIDLNFSGNNFDLKVIENPDSIFSSTEIISQKIPPEVSKLISSTNQGKSYLLKFSGEYLYPTKETEKEYTNEGSATIFKESNIPVPFIIETNDFSLVSSVTPTNDPNLLLGDYLKIQSEAQLIEQDKLEAIEAAQKTEEKKALDTQISEALNTQSALELTLRAIQLHALNKAIAKNNNDLEIGRLVYPLNIASLDDKTSSGATFLSQIFSNGIFSSFINRLVNKSTPISIQGYSDNVKSLDRLRRLEIQAKYGFATSLMGNSAEIDTLTACDFESILKAFVVPYQINQEIIKGTSTNHPVYIPFGLLLMILNHCCTIYDSKKGDKTQTPLVYIDFNTEHNYFLSNTKQLSTNPWVTLIPFEGTFDDYKKLFDTNVLNGDNIKPVSGSQENTPLFNPTKQDALSGQIPPIKFDQSNNNVYRGKMMNILLNIDYLVKTVKDFSYRDGTNSIYLKEFIEQILTDINKYLGKINVFRLSYNDKGNTFQIIDDQFIPVKDQEEQISSNDVKTLGTILSTSNTTELPLIGKYSIAKTLEIKSDVSTKLANTLAISANADFEKKATLSQNGDNYGYINTSYQDRFINIRSQVENTDTGSKTDATIDTLINSATQFNQTISDFYSKINPSETTVDQATNYYIDKMAKIKNNDYPTRASAMIPVSVNFSTDGVSGFLMGQAFTIPDELLPYTYNARKVPGKQGLDIDHINKVGFVVVGLNHSLESNQWTTSVRANMIFLKNKTEFQGQVSKLNTAPRAFEENQNRDSSFSGYAPTEKSTPIGTEKSIKIAKTFFEQKRYTPIQVSAIIGGLLQESELNPNAVNPSSGAYGIAQWLGERKEKLLSKPNYSNLEVQLNYVVEEFNSTESIAGTRLKRATTLEEAIAAMASYERYKGVTISSTYKDVLVAEETGFRIGYTKSIFNRYYTI